MFHRSHRTSFVRFLGSTFILLSALFSAHSAFAATLSFSPVSANVSVGDIVSLKVLVGTDGTAINVAEGTIEFPADLLQVMSVNKSSSIFSLWVQDPAFSNTAGTITWNGGLQNPGFTGEGGEIMTVTFIAKKSGNASILFSNSTVLANDGLGTDVLSSTSDAAIAITVPVTSAPSIALGAPIAPVITSTTNPDPNKWYNNPNPSFSWNIPSDTIAIKLEYGNDVNALPSVTHPATMTEKNLADLPDGVYYFHAQFENSAGWGAIGQFEFSIDTVPPEPFTISFPDGASLSGPKVSIDFKTTDKLSGIDHYSVQIDSENPIIVLPDGAGAPYVLPPQSAGNHTVVVTAFDKAGNSTIATANFSIAENPIVGFGDIIINYTSVIILVVLLAASLIGLFWRVFLKISSLKKKVRREVVQAENILHKSFDLLKEDIDEHTRALLKAKTRRALTNEEDAFLKKFGANLTEAESIISKEIKNIENLK